MEDIDQTTPIVSAQWGAGYTGEMEGGITVDGSAQWIFQLTPPISYGGKDIGGSSDCKVFLSYTMSGGIVTGGTIDVSGDFISIAATIGGSASVTTSYIPVVNGSVELGGSADTVIGFARTMTGGVSINGSSDSSQSFSYTMNGGISTNGVAIERAAIGFIGIGIVNIEGSAFLGSGYKHTMAGGITTGGHVESTSSLACTGKGGVILSGHAQAVCTLYYTSTGGVVTGGAIANPRFALTYQSSGGIEIGGQSRAFWGRSYTMTGGIVTDGSNGSGSGLLVNYNYKPEFPHNRVFLYGKASCGSDSFYYSMSGGIISGGVGDIDYCAVACDTTSAYYRSEEALKGCRVILPNGKIDYICARSITYQSVDVIRKGGQRGAIVPSVTVCQQGLVANTQNTKKNCGAFIRK